MKIKGIVKSEEKEIVTNDKSNMELFIEKTM